ncbi:MAG: hypothetical protein IKZ60_05490 [Bacteroidales bacterium]|nr:hypothetical protein [Bacteroidales bacterium]
MKSTLYVLLAAMLIVSCSKKDERDAFAGADSPVVPVYELEDNSELAVTDSIPRGSAITVLPGKSVKENGIRYLPARIGKKKFYLPETALVSTLGEAVMEKELFVQTAASVIDDTLSSHICGFAKKGSKVDVLGYDKILPDGNIRRYKVQTGKQQGWIFGKYLVGSAEKASERFNAFDEAHRAVKNSFKGGEAAGCEFRPYERPVFADNPMPNPVNAFYLTINPAGLKNIDAYIALADSTKINAFVIDIKDNECPGYKAEAMEKYSPTNYKWAGANKEKLYKEAIDKLHAKGYYVIGRITCFKDSYYAKDHPGSSICEKATGQPFLHNKSYWPSAYSRDVWQFNVELAKESVRKFGLNEVNFDYVRFPDKMISIDEQMDYRNRYGESKVQAIQNFVRYACDELHSLGVYVSVDVFGESSNPGYTTAYGQYWPAISTIADAICAMPYPDHFADHYYGISKPWNHPYEILKAWGKRVQGRQAVTASPAIVRTWIQAYHVMRWVDPHGIDNNSNFIEREIRGLYDAGLTGGFCTWLASGNIVVYRSQIDAYKLDYPSLPPIDSLNTFINPN